MRKEQLSAGNGGWTLYQSLNPDLMAWLRFADRDGRLVMVELFLVDDDGLGTDALRSLPLGRIDAWANGEMADFIRAALNEPGPDLRRLASYYSTRLTPSKKANDHWVMDSFLAQVEGSGVPQAPMRRTRVLDDSEPTFTTLALEFPPGRDHGDDFYATVARLYASLSREVRAPAMALAKANDVPVTTARRWIKEARARGFLPAGRAGKAG